MPFRVDLASPDLAEDGALVARLADLVNAAYAIGEAGMWKPGTARVSADEIGALIRAEQLLVLRADGEIVGCVRVHDLGDSIQGFGMLAVDPHRQSGGGGGALVDAVEQRASDRGARASQLELLVPLHGAQDSKARLKTWYSARGYALVEEGLLEHDHPELVPLLAVPCTYEVWRKALPAEAPGSD